MKATWPNLGWVRRIIGPEEGPDVVTCRPSERSWSARPHPGRRKALYIWGRLYSKPHFSRSCCGDSAQTVSPPSQVATPIPVFRKVHPEFVFPFVLLLLPLKSFLLLLLWFSLLLGSGVMARTSPREARSGNLTDDLQSTPEVEVSSLLGPNVDRLREQYCIPEQF